MLYIGPAVWLRAVGAVNAKRNMITQGVCPCGAYLLVWATNDRLIVMRDGKKMEQQGKGWETMGLVVSEGIVCPSHYVTGAPQSAGRSFLRRGPDR